MSILTRLANLADLANHNRHPKERKVPDAQTPDRSPVRSVVQVYFPSANRTLSYYNDMFDLRPGDYVYVEGKLAGIRGRVVQLSRSFKIKLSDYKRVISVADTHVRGQFYLAGDYFLTFSPQTLPYEKLSGWFRAENDEPEEYVTGDVVESVSLSGPLEFQVSPEIAERGRNYYYARKVRGLCLDNQRGRAIVEGTMGYEVEFVWNTEEKTVSSLNCGCPCYYHCKHEYAVLLQLQETLDLIGKHYASQYEKSRYFMAVSRSAFFTFAGSGSEAGSFIWNG